MPDAPDIVLCSKLCRHNPADRTLGLIQTLTRLLRCSYPVSRGPSIFLDKSGRLIWEDGRASARRVCCSQIWLQCWLTCRGMLQDVIGLCYNYQRRILPSSCNALWSKWATQRGSFYFWKCHCGGNRETWNNFLEIQHTPRKLYQLYNIEFLQMPFSGLRFCK